MDPLILNWGKQYPVTCRIHVSQYWAKTSSWRKVETIHSMSRSTKSPKISLPTFLVEVATVTIIKIWCERKWRKWMQLQCSKQAQMPITLETLEKGNKSKRRMLKYQCQWTISSELDPMSEKECSYIRMRKEVELQLFQVVNGGKCKMMFQNPLSIKDYTITLDQQQSISPWKRFKKHLSTLKNEIHHCWIT